MNELLKLRRDPLLLSLINSISCMVAIGEPATVNEVLELINMVNEFPVAKKYLLLVAPTFEPTVLKNLTINFQVIFNYSETGKNH